jgi:hypothetical protein
VSSQVEKSLQATAETIGEATRTSTERFKASYQVKVVETHESGEERRVLRRIQNPNYSRTLTLNHFEVLENYQVATIMPEEPRWCVLVENADIGHFDLAFVLAHEYRLQQVLLSPNYRPGFAAARTLQAQQWYQNSLLKAQIEEHTRGSSAGAEVNQSGAKAAARVPEKGLFATALSLRELLEKFDKLDLEHAFDTLFRHHARPPWDTSPVDEHELREAEGAIRRYSFWLKLDMVYGGFSLRARDFLAAVPKELFDDRANEDRIVRELGKLLAGLDDEWLYGLKMLAVAAVVGAIVGLAVSVLAAPLLVPGLITAILTPAITSLVFLHDDMGLPRLIDTARKQLLTLESAGQLALVASTGAATPPAGANRSADAAGHLPPQIPTVFSLQDLARAHADFEALRLHLEAHRTYYQNEIWRAEPSDQRYERLRQLGIAGFVDNRLLGFVGRQAIYPLRMSALSDGVHASLMQQFAGIDPSKIRMPESMTLALPTGGMHLETVLGQCDGLEPYMQDRRAIDLQLRQAEAARVVAEAEQAHQEALRLQRRLAQTPPLLDPPFGPAPLPLAERVNGAGLDDNRADAL